MNFRPSTTAVIVFALSASLSAGVAQACLTPQSAHEMGLAYPDWDFATMMHEMHGNQPYIGFNFEGVQTCDDGLIASEFKCQNVTLLGHLDLPQIGDGFGNDSWGWKHEPSGRYFALVGRTNGTAFVEITDPANPVYLAELPTQTDSSSWRDLKTYQDHVFIVSDFNDNHGMQVFDLNRLLDVANPPQTMTPDHVYLGVMRAHNIVINEDSGFAYLVGSNTCDGGLHMLDISSPTSPTFSGCFDADGYTHDAQCVNYTGPDTEHQGKEICFASNTDTLTIIDVTDKDNPAQISRTTYDGVEYTHQGWLTEDQRYFLLDDELDEVNGRRLGNQGLTTTYVWDLVDLDAPLVVGTHLSTEAASDHNQYIHGNYTYQANYVSGLRVLEIVDGASATLEEVAFFDSYPTEPPTGTFRGAWNTYPFFDNRTVLVSDINRGIFILEINLPVFNDGFE